MKVVLDANVYVSSLISPLGNLKKIVEYWGEGHLEVLLSVPIIAEIGRVLRYPRIARRHKQDERNIQRFLKLLSSQATVTHPTIIVDAVKEDETDNRYLECAIAGEAEYIVSGDKHLLALREFQGIVILPPTAFIKLLESRHIRLH